MARTSSQSANLSAFSLQLQLLLLLLLLSAYATTTASARHRQHMSVNIMNDVADSKPIYVRCRSQDDDLHVQTIMPSQWYGFGFEANVYGTTLYWCNFVHGARSQGVVAFQDIGFWGDKERWCRQCVWVVKAEGFYRSEGNNGPWTFVTAWN